MPRYTEPEAQQAMLLEKLNLNTVSQPRLSSAINMP
jgi:hypothetical protein